MLINIIGCSAILFNMIPSGAGSSLLITLITLAGSYWYFRKEENRLFPLITLAFSMLVVHQYRAGKLIDFFIQYFI